MRAFVPYRSDVSESFEVRWLIRPCGAFTCIGSHPTAIVSFDGADRWAACVRCPPDYDVQGEDEQIEYIEEREDAFRRVVAAYGLPWAVLMGDDGEQLIRQEVEVFERPALISRELARHDVDGVLSLRRMVGRDLAALTHTLGLLGRYREDVGGESGVWHG